MRASCSPCMLSWSSFFVFSFNDTATTDIYTLSLHDALPIYLKTLSLQPRPFLGANGFQWDYEHLDSDELWRRGRAVGAVIDGKLYLILFDAARSHYYNALLPDFEAIVASAQRQR